MNKNNPIFFLLLTAIISIFHVTVFASENSIDNMEEKIIPVNNVNHKASAHKFYQKFISPVDGDRCQMYPTCSTYSKNAIKKHGYFIGWIIRETKEAVNLRWGKDFYRLK